jgi:hypothetical protein
VRLNDAAAVDKKKGYMIQNTPFAKACLFTDNEPFPAGWVGSTVILAEI